VSQKITAIRGMNDVLPVDTPMWQFVDNQLSELMSSYGYQQIRLPIVEQTELFKRSIGEVTDIVEKEMYTFNDRNNESLTLRPEGTASCVRAALEHGLLHNQTQRLWYTGPMFRYERPQKGRYRQFHQVGVEAFGMAGPDIDAEIILMTARLWQKLAIANSVVLEINSLGNVESRLQFRNELVSYLSTRVNELDADSQRRLATNPLRILDSKDSNTQTILQDAPQLSDYLDADSKQHFEKLTGMLSMAGISYRVNPRLVRGLDYYGKTVFEWVTDQLGAQGTVCAGGRYDGLVEQLGGRSTPAVGFAIGLERLILLLGALKAVPDAVTHYVDVYLVASEEALPQALVLAETIRAYLPTLGVLTHCGGGGFKNQLKKADNSGARMALILGEDEIKNGHVTIKFLRESKDQQQISVNEVTHFLHNIFMA
jgi:histidyl-tRNA synthetase